MSASTHRRSGDQETAARILRVAAQLFGERGYAGATIKELAARVGITPGAVYWHFPSKEAILVAHLLGRIDEIVSEVREALGPGPAPVRLAALARAQVRVLLRQTEDAKTLPIFGVSHLAEVLDSTDYALVASRQRRHVELVRGIVCEGIAEGAFRADLDPTPTALAILGFCDSITLWYRPGRRLHAAAAAEMVADFVVHMVSRTG